MVLFSRRRIRGLSASIALVFLAELSLPALVHASSVQGFDLVTARADLISQMATLGHLRAEQLQLEATGSLYSKYRYNEAVTLHVEKVQAGIRRLAENGYTRIADQMSSQAAREFARGSVQESVSLNQWRSEYRSAERAYLDAVQKVQDATGMSRRDAMQAVRSRDGSHGTARASRALDNLREVQSRRPDPARVEAEAAASRNAPKRSFWEWLTGKAKTNEVFEGTRENPFKAEERSSRSSSSRAESRTSSSRSSSGSEVARAQARYEAIVQRIAAETGQSRSAVRAAIKRGDSGWGMRQGRDAYQNLRSAQGHEGPASRSSRSRGSSDASSSRSSSNRGSSSGSEVARAQARYESIVQRISTETGASRSEVRAAIKRGDSGWGMRQGREAYEGLRQAQGNQGNSSRSSRSPSSRSSSDHSGSRSGQEARASGPKGSVAQAQARYEGVVQRIAEHTGQSPKEIRAAIKRGDSGWGMGQGKRAYDNLQRAQGNEARAGKGEARASEAAEGAAGKTAGTHMSEIARGSLKWAGLQVGMDLGFRAIVSSFRHGQVDWGYVTAPMKTLPYWGGVAGASILGATAMHFLSAGLAGAGPLGQVARLAVVFGAAGFGHHLGSGTLGQVDWGRFAATTVAGALGSVLALGLGPIGAIAGGMIGSWIGGKVYDWLMEAGGPEMIARPFPGDPGPPGVSGPDPTRGGFAGGYSDQRVAPMNDQGRVAYNSVLAAMEQGDQAAIRASYQDYRQTRGGFD